MLVVGFPAVGTDPPPRQKRDGSVDLVLFGPEEVLREQR